MGCDIHPIIEYKEFKSSTPYKDWWSAIGIPDHSRCYDFFALIAGVRGEAPFEQVALPEMPNDIHYLTQTLLSNDHTPCWFSLARARMFDSRVREHCRTHDYIRALDMWDSWLAFMEFVLLHAPMEERTPENVRVVMDFDS